MWVSTKMSEKILLAISLILLGLLSNHLDLRFLLIQFVNNRATPTKALERLHLLLMTFALLRIANMRVIF